MIAGETRITWQDYLAVVVRRRWYFVVPCVATVSIAMAVGVTLPRIYRTETVLLLEDPKIMNPLMQGMAIASPVETRMRIVQEELLGWTSLSRLVHELGLDQGATDPEAFEGLVKKLQKDITVMMRAGNLISLAYTNPNPELAQRVLNTVTSIYIQRSVESQTAEAETAIKFIESEMEVYRKKLEESERSLRDFKELHATEMPVATQLNNQIVALEVQLAQLLVENTEEHPTVLQIRRQVHELKQRRNEEIKRVITASIAKGRNPEIYQDLLKTVEAPAVDASQLTPAVRAAREAYQAWVDRMENATVTVTAPAQPGPSTEVGRLASPPSPAPVESGAVALSLGPREEQELARLNRDYEIHRNTYLEMKQRLERARITQRLGESNEGTKFKVIEPARLPLRPTFPNLWLFFFGSLVGGLAVGTAVAFTAEYLDDSFQTAEDVQAALELPVIGAISTIVTEADVQERRRRQKSWVSYRDQWRRMKAHVFTPVWSRVDRLLVRWGL